MSVRMPKFHAPAQLTRTAKAARSPLVQGCVSCAYALHSKASLQAARAYVQTSCAHVIVTGLFEGDGEGHQQYWKAAGNSAIGEGEGRPEMTT